MGLQWWLVRSVRWQSRSAQAAKEIEGLISESVRLIDQGSGEVVAAGNTMTDIVDAVKRVTDIMLEIAAASDEQSRGIVRKAVRFQRWIRSRSKTPHWLKKHRLLRPLLKSRPHA